MQEDGRPHKKGSATAQSCAQEGRRGVDGGAWLGGFKKAQEDSRSHKNSGATQSSCAHEGKAGVDGGAPLGSSPWQWLAINEWSGGKFRAIKWSTWSNWAEAQKQNRAAPILQLLR